MTAEAEKAAAQTGPRLEANEDPECLHDIQEDTPKVRSSHANRGMALSFWCGIIVGVSILLGAALLSGVMALAFVLNEGRSADGGSRPQGRMRGSISMQPAGYAPSPSSAEKPDFVASALDGGLFCDGRENEGRWRHLSLEQASSSTMRFHEVLDSVGRNTSDPRFSERDDFSWAFDREPRGDPCKILPVVDAMSVLAKSASRVAFLGTDVLSQVAQGVQWTYDLLKRRGDDSTVKLQSYSWGCITETHEMLYNAFSSMGLMDRQNEGDRQSEILIIGFGDEYVLNSSHTCDCNWAERNDSKALSFGDRFFHNPSECFDDNDVVLTKPAYMEWDTCIAEHSWTKCMKMTEALCSMQVLDQCSFQRNLVYLSRFLSHNRHLLPKHVFWFASTRSDSSTWRDDEANAILSKFAPHVRMINATTMMKSNPQSHGREGAGAHDRFNSAVFEELLAVTLSSFNAATHPAFAQRGTTEPEDTPPTEGADFDIKVVAGAEVDPPQPEWSQHQFKEELEQKSFYGQVWMHGVTCATQMQSVGQENSSVSCANAVHKTPGCGDFFVFDKFRPFLGCHCCGKEELQYSNESKPASKHFTMYVKRMPQSWEEKLLKVDDKDFQHDLWLMSEIQERRTSMEGKTQRDEKWKLMVAMEAAAKANRRSKRQRSNVKK